ncbi:uncharacterized protein [Rutidosis leptorrhynchoides]|uniref:uncharacterized protein n=1 Tax=Rutidosis leptorrhynchoides TaxID=125765 RepID=UPI003A9A538B
MAAYCQELKMNADQLADVDSNVEPHRLVLQLVAGLNDNYAQIRTHINQMEKLPTFYDARSKLILEESLRNRQLSITNANGTHTTALISTAKNQENPNQTERDYNSNNSGSSSSYRGRGGRNGNRGGRGGNRGRGRNQNHSRSYNPNWYPSNNWSSQNQHWATQAPWAQNYFNPPWANPNSPCLYPTTPWTRPNLPAPSAGLLGPRPQAQYSSNSSTSSYSPTDIDQALYTMSLNPPDDNWYMDSGASSHMTSNRGILSLPILI